MTPCNKTRIACLGSDFGDDRLGLWAAEALSERLPTCLVTSLRHPLNLLDDLADVEALHIVDACRGAGPPGTILHWEWPTTAVASVKFSGTHDLNLEACLQLGDALKVLPPFVTLWGVECGTDPWTFAAEMSPEVAAAAPRLIEQIAAQVRPSDNVEGEVSCNA